MRSIFETDRIRLTPISNDDLPQLVTWLAEIHLAVHHRS